MVWWRISSLVLTATSLGVLLMLSRLFSGMGLMKWHTNALATAMHSARLFAQSSLPYLAHKLPFAPQSPKFLEEQLRAMKNKYSAPHYSFSLVNLKEGQEFLALTGTIGAIYGGVPLYEANATLSEEEQREVKRTIDALGCRWAKFIIAKDVNCIKLEDQRGEARWFVSDDFLEECLDADSSLKPKA